MECKICDLGSSKQQMHVKIIQKFKFFWNTQYTNIYCSVCSPIGYYIRRVYYGATCLQRKYKNNNHIPLS